MADNRLKIKQIESLQEELDSNANIVSINFNDLVTLKGNSDLNIGTFYYIQNLENPILIKAIEVNKLSLSAYIKAFNPDYQAVGDYSGVVGFTGQLGVWRPTRTTFSYTNLMNGPFQTGETVNNLTTGGSGIVTFDTGTGLTLEPSTGSFANGNNLIGLTSGATADINSVASVTFPTALNKVVIWNNRHWKNISGTNSLIDPVTDGGANWVSLTEISTNGYIIEWDLIEYDTFPTNSALWWVQRRKDKRGNDIQCTRYAAITVFGLSTNPVTELFQWGNDKTIANKCFESYINCINQLNECQGNVLEAASRVDNISWGTEVKFNTNTLLQGSSINNVKFGGNLTRQNNTQFQGNKFFTGIFEDNDFPQTGSKFNFNTLANPVSIKNKSFGLVTFTSNYFGKNWILSEVIGAIVGTLVVNKKTVDSAFSNFETFFDVTATTVVDLATVQLGEIAGIVTLDTTDPTPITKTVDQIDNMPTDFPIEFRATSDLTVTFVHEPIATAGNGDITLEGGVNFDILGYGSTSDFLVLRRDQTDAVPGGYNIRQINASKLS